ncbi:MAG: hypothetical protein HN612_08255 [Kordiimonadaceae bacterium]|jgi:hypothetical protein|nr:hypothetical protein [Kordiimonadaceae bacterium]
MLAINKLKNILMILLLFLVWSQSSFAMNSWNFKVFYGDKEIGEHHFSLKKEGDKRRVMIEADFNIDILFINVYSYKHKNTEIWEGSCLSTIESITDDNGEAFITNGKYENGVFKINSKQGTNEVVGCVSTFAYWDKSFLDNEVLLNSQTGEIVDVDISFVADEKILIRDKLVNAKKYKLKSDKLNIDLWYSDENQWLALNSITEDGTNLRYQMK